MQKIDFTHCPRVAGKAYNGANGKKIGYYEFLHGNHPAELDTILAQLLPAIKQLDFEAFLQDVPYLSDLQRQFYTAYLTSRREKIFAGLM